MAFLGALCAAIMDIPPPSIPVQDYTMASFWIARKRVHAQGRLDRRSFLAHAAACSAIPLLGERVEGRTACGFPGDADPFSVGVASGDPTSTGAVLWTRLAPRPLEPGGGMPRENLEVN